MSSDSSRPRSGRTQLTDRPKLSLGTGTANSRLKPAKKAARKTQSENRVTPRTGPSKGQRTNPNPANGSNKNQSNSGSAAKGGVTKKGSAPFPKPAKREAKPLALNSRRICFDILTAVANGAQFDAAMGSNDGFARLDDRDRRFVQLLAATCLRRRGQLEKVIAPLVTRRPFGPQENANIILLMGAAQLLILKTGPHAAVDSTVELMREAGFDRLTGLANAVMRRLSREGEARFATTTPLDNVPDWLRMSWQTHYGSEATAAIAEMAMQTPPFDITPKADAAQWAETLDGVLINGTTVRRAFDGDITKLEGFATGEWWVQDAAAALPATLFGNLAGKTVIDLCAAPGGKTAQLAAAGAAVTAIDNGRKRIDRLRRNLKRLHLPAEILLAEGQSHKPAQRVDHVLLDAPCSATGTLRRRPDILVQRQPETIATLQAIQWDLTTSAIGWLKPGGTMVYATCSLQPEEGEDIIAAVIEAGKGRVAIDPVTSQQAGDFARSITADGALRILPGDYADIGGMDGFYIARLKSLG